MTETETTSKDNRGEVRTAKWNTASSVFGALSALLGLVVAVLGVFAVRSNQTADEATTEAQDLSSTVESQRETISGLEAQVVAQEEEIARLRAEDSPAPPPGDTPAVWREGTLDINPTSDKVDLDSPQTDTQWGRSTFSTPEGLTYYGNTDLWVAPQSGVVVMDKPADYATCAAETNYSTERLEIARLAPNAQLCVITSEERYGVLTVNSADSEKVSFDVIIWDNQ